MATYKGLSVVVPEQEQQEREDWQAFADRYPRESRALARNMWNFVRSTLRINPRRLGKARMTKMFGKLARGESVKGLKGDKLKYAQGWAQRMVQREEYIAKGEVRVTYTDRPRGAWARGLYGEISKSPHRLRAASGRVYERTYRRWNANEVSLLRSTAYSPQQKATMLNRSARSVETKMQRLGIVR